MQSDLGVITDYLAQTTEHDARLLPPLTVPSAQSVLSPPACIPPAYPCQREIEFKQSITRFAGIQCGYYCDPQTGAPVEYGQVLCIRLPRVYGNRHVPDEHDVAEAFSSFGAVQAAWPVDNKGGFVIRMGGDPHSASIAAHNAITWFCGKANLAGDLVVEQLLTAPEAAVGALIGQNGTHLRDMKATSGAHIEVSEWAGANATRFIHLSGQMDMVCHAQQIVESTIRGALALKPPQSSAEALPLPLPLPKPRPPEKSANTDALPVPECTSLLDFPPLPGSRIWEAPTPGMPFTSNHDSRATGLDSSTVDIGCERLLDDAVWLDTEIKPNTPASSSVFGCPAESKVPTVHPMLLQLQRQHSARTVSRLVAHASWCMLKNRVAVMTAFREALAKLTDTTPSATIPATCTFEASEQEAQAAQQGIRFGVRSRSWANFVHDKPFDEVQVQAQ